MSLQIIKSGIADTLQDKGRYGYQNLGIQANGYLDYLSAQLANDILCNPIQSPVFELHFPSSSFVFKKSYTICITGANFAPILNEKSIALYTPIQVKENDCLQFLQPIAGRVSYLAIQGQIQEKDWLESHSFFNRRLQKGDQFVWAELDAEKRNETSEYNKNNINDINNHIFSTHPLQFIPGPAWEDLTKESQQTFLSTEYHIGIQANRMGYPLKGKLLELSKPKEYISSAVTRGTIQFLPNGALMVLMADHQTIGGYANLGQIILVDLPRLTQMPLKTSIHFKETSVETAHKSYLAFEKKFIHRS